MYVYVWEDPKTIGLMEIIMISEGGFLKYHEWYGTYNDNLMVVLQFASKVVCL